MHCTPSFEQWVIHFQVYTGTNYFPNFGHPFLLQLLPYNFIPCKYVNFDSWVCRFHKRRKIVIRISAIHKSLLNVNLQNSKILIFAALISGHLSPHRFQNHHSWCSLCRISKVESFNMRKHYYKILFQLNWIPGLDEVYMVKMFMVVVLLARVNGCNNSVGIYNSVCRK